MAKQILSNPEDNDKERDDERDPKQTDKEGSQGDQGQSSDESDDQIHVGAGGSLIVPREELLDDVDVGDELDLAKLQKKKLRKPHRREWIALNVGSELTTHFLVHKPRLDGIETEYYFVDGKLRAPIRDELKPVRILIYFSFATGEYGLWPINVNIGNSWYESLVVLLNQPAEFFLKKELRVVSDKSAGVYRVKYRAIQQAVDWPKQETGQLLGDALGPDRFITDANHELYRDLIDGKQL